MDKHSLSERDICTKDIITALGVAIHEYQTNTRPTNGIRFIDRKPIGVINA